MSSNKKVKLQRQKKQLSPQAKRNLSNIFGSLISNKKVIDGAKELPIWVALIFFVLSAFLPVIPTMVSTANSYGSSFIASTTYNLDRTLPELCYELKENGSDFIVDKENNQLLGYKDYNSEELYDPYLTTPVASYIDESTHQYSLHIYYTASEFGGAADDTHSFAYFKDTVLSRKYRIGTTTEVVVETEGENYYSPSIVVLHKNRLYFYIFQPNTTSPLSGSYEGSNWTNYAGEDSLLTTVLKGADHTKPLEFGSKVLDNWRVVLDNSYVAQRDSTLLASTFIFMGIYAGLILFLGLLVFLLTRGKTNIFRYLKFLTCLKISAWAALAPAILGLIFGFLFGGNQSVMFFIMFIGIRIMWLTMKQLRPQQM